MLSKIADNLTGSGEAGDMYWVVKVNCLHQCFPIFLRFQSTTSYKKVKVSNWKLLTTLNAKKLIKFI